MKILIPVCVLLAICGCGIGYRISHVQGTISGTNITTPYGPATGNLEYDATTCFGNCPKAQELINADKRSQTNTAS